MGAQAGNHQQEDVGKRHEQGDAEDFRRLLSPTVAGVHLHRFQVYGAWQARSRRTQEQKDETQYDLAFQIAHSLTGSTNTRNTEDTMGPRSKNLIHDTIRCLKP